MAEVHIIGQILGAEGFKDRNVFCKWGIVAGSNWDLLEGTDQGQTQVDHPPEGEDAVWSHPIDVHYACRGLSGWPKLYFQVWHQDIHGRNDICGYGFCHVPTEAGCFDLDCVTWLPEGSVLERISAFFIGGGPRLKVEETVYNSGDRFRLRTRAGGTVHIQISVLLKDFARHNIRYR
ncbi:b9 domain-containing protein [Klebsormidium nitens]|uniref:B9 domain-containing protein n=1 Tax=Klebsormidium nitens TaxID=105231 RepID=A0A1Y1IHR7_KLENI|nr:b9 domain-containing protein [Klebsormidium nitens]|eukprot:GAQ87688.1 b9 domain-containing protein [Klebsormidium nitens]